MDIHMATEVSYRNGYDRAAADLRETTEWVKIDESKYQCKSDIVENYLDWGFVL